MNLTSLTDDELLAWVDRNNPEVKELAERLEMAINYAESLHERLETTLNYAESLHEQLETALNNTKSLHDRTFDTLSVMETALKKIDLKNLIGD